MKSSNSILQNKSAISKKNKIYNPIYGELQLFASKKPNKTELHEIPKNQISSNQPGSSSKHQKKKKIKPKNLTKIPSELPTKSSTKKTKGLTEITPKSFKSSIIASKGVYGSPKVKVSEPQKKKSTINPSSMTTKKTLVPQDISVYKRKQLEEDMLDVLSVLSKKFPKVEKPKSKTPKAKKSKEVIPPASFNEILKQLLKFDLHIEASAIMKNNGSILASALSDNISDTLFSTIGQNLSMIGTDIIEGLSAGSLKSIKIEGTKGILDLAPIDRESKNLKDMMLIIFSHPKVKSGIISFAVSIVQKKIKEYLGLDKPYDRL